MNSNNLELGKKIAANAQSANEILKALGELLNAVYRHPELDSIQISTIQNMMKTATNFVTNAENLTRQLKLYESDNIIKGPGL